MLKILQRELAPCFVHRPTVVELLSVDGSSYYHDQLTGISTAIPGLQKDVAGGIICEDMVGLKDRWGLRWRDTDWISLII
jgi:hypothetical protein